MNLPVIEEPIRFHLSLNVPDLNRAIEFYSVLFGQRPTKQHDDYAKFDLADPPVVFSLVPQTPGPGTTLSHLGLRVSSDDKIQEYRNRLEAAGHCCETQDGTTCGYAKQNKVWVSDPFGNFWEVYRIEEDVRPEVIRTSLEGKSARIDAPECNSHPSKEKAEIVWEHFITNPLESQISHTDQSVDEVRLTGSFNANLNDNERLKLLQEAFRILKPGGKLVTHGLMANREIKEQPKLPGLAAMVSRVPSQMEPIEFLKGIGFVGVQFLKYTDKAWFQHEGAELREVKLIAWKPFVKQDATTKQILYKGPFAKITIDAGVTLERGKRTSVSNDVWEQLRLGAGAEQFLFLEADGNSACSV